MAGSGVLYVVATPIGNMGDISARAREILAGVGAVAAEDTRHSGRLLRELGLERPLVSLHEHNERARIGELIARLRGGESIALVSDAGTPLVSDPGYLLVAAAIEAGITVSPVPGPNAAIAALCASGLALRALFLRGIPAGARRGAPAAPRRTCGGAAHAGAVRSAASHRRVPRRPRRGLRRKPPRLHRARDHQALRDFLSRQPRRARVAREVGRGPRARRGRHPRRRRPAPRNPPQHNSTRRSRSCCVTCRRRPPPRPPPASRASVATTPTRARSRSRRTRPPTRLEAGLPRH